MNSFEKATFRFNEKIAKRGRTLREQERMYAKHCRAMRDAKDCVEAYPFYACTSDCGGNDYVPVDTCATIRQACISAMRNCIKYGKSINYVILDRVTGLVVASRM